MALGGESLLSSPKQPGKLVRLSETGDGSSSL